MFEMTVTNCLFFRVLQEPLCFSVSQMDVSDEVILWRSILSPAVTLHTGMCRSEAVVRVIDRDRGKRTET